MIIKKEFKTDNVIRSTVIDNIDKVDEGILEDGVKFINIYKKDRKKEDEFETIIIQGLNVYCMSDEGKTLSIYRSKG